MYKIIFSTGRGKKFGQFKTFDLKHFLKVGCPTEDEEEAEGGFEDILGTPVKDAELKVASPSGLPARGFIGRQL